MGESGHLDTVFQTHGPILIRGRTGTGKRRFAQKLHTRVPGDARPFVVHDCADRSCLNLRRVFLGEYCEVQPGHYQRRLGLLEAARDGTLLLERVEQLPTDIQELLAKILAEGMFTPLQGDAPVNYRARTVSCTEADLPSLAERGQFDSTLLEHLSENKLELS